MTYDIKRIYEWPLAPRAIAIGIICLIVLYFGYFFDLSGLNHKITVAQQNEQELKTQLQSLANNTANLRTQLLKYSSLETDLAQLKKQLVNTNDLSEQLNEIIQIGKQNNIEFLNFTPGTQEDTHNSLKVEIKTSIMGHYDQIANFISQVSNVDKLIVISSLTIAKNTMDKTMVGAAMSSHLVADLTLVVYEAKTP